MPSKTKKAYFVRYYDGNDNLIVAPCHACTYGGAIQQARLLLLDSAKKITFVEIYDVDPRLTKDAKPIATRFG